MRKYKPPHPTIISRRDVRPNGLNRSGSCIEGIILGEVEGGREIRKWDTRKRKEVRREK
jgi:hypothetical protein